MTENEQTKRDKKIKSQYDFRAGVTMRQLSKKYDISIGRIQQIINFLRLGQNKNCLYFFTIKILNHYGKRRIDERVQKWYKKLCTFVILRCLTYLARGIKILTDSSNGFSVSAGKYDSNESVVCTSRRKWWDYKFYVYQNAHHHFRLFMRQDYSLESLVLPVASSGG